MDRFLIRLNKFQTMRRLLLTLSLALCFSMAISQHNTQDQWDTKIPRAAITESVERMSLGDNSALVMMVNGEKTRTVEKEVSKLLKEMKSRAKKNKAGELYAEGVYLHSIDQSLDVYTIVEEAGEGSRLVMFFKMGDNYVRSDVHPEVYKSAWSVLREIDLRIAKAKVEEELDDEAKALKNLERERESLKKELMNMINLVEKKKQEIIQLEKDQEVNQEEQKRVESEIDRQREVLRRVEDELKKYKW